MLPKENDERVQIAADYPGPLMNRPQSAQPGTP